MNKKKHICFLVNVDWFFYSHRELLAKGLESSGFEVSLIAGDTGEPEKFNDRKFKIKGRVPTIKSIGKIRRELTRIGKIDNFIVVSPVMILIFHFLFPKYKKAIYNFSGLGFLRKLPNFVQSILLFLMKIYPHNGTRAIVLQNTDDYKIFIKIFNNSKKFQVNLIPGSGYVNSCKTKPIKLNTGLKIGYVGRLNKQKGILELIQCVEELKNYLKDLNLYLWGRLDDSRRHGFNKKELDYLEENKKYFCGESKDKRTIFESFDVFCLPSSGEGLSKAAIEAASFYKPLLLSDVEGNRDMISGNGYLFEYGNISDLKIKVEKMYYNNNMTYDDLAHKSRELFEEKWTFEKILRQWMEII